MTFQLILWNLNLKVGNSKYCRCCFIHQYTISIQSGVGVGWGHKTRWRQPGLRICTQRSPKQQDVWFWLVDFVVDPASWLLHSDVSPFLNKCYNVQLMIEVCLWAASYRPPWVAWRVDTRSDCRCTCPNIRFRLDNAAFNYYYNSDGDLWHT